MKKVIAGIIIGIVLIIVFLYFGGSRYLKSFGEKTEEAGDKIQKYERTLKDSVDSAKDSVEKSKERIKKYMPE